MAAPWNLTFTMTVKKSFNNAEPKIQHCQKKIYISIYEPVSVKTGLNDMKIKIKRTASLGSVSFSELFLKI